MSREAWYSGMVGTQTSLASVGLSPPRKLSSLTSDPEAADHDEACEIFLNGLRLARGGDLAAGVPQIACAYLLDSRSINFLIQLPEDCVETKRNFVLDYELLGKLIEHDTESFGSSVLRILLANQLGTTPFGQQLIAAAMVHINGLYEYVENNPAVEAPGSGLIGGCLTRKILLRERSALYMAMGNYKCAIGDLTKALKIDENWTWARESRACIWGSTKLKGYDVIHREFKRVISESHKDNRGNEVAYAWLALTILNDRSLGSLEDAKGYYDLCKVASARYEQIYGERRDERIPPPVKLVRQSFGEEPIEQEQINDIINSLQSTSLGLESHSKKRECVKCGATSNKEGGRLHQCSRCHVANYCSRECQVDDWKNHKEFCKIMKNDRKERKNKVSSPVIQEPTQTAENDVAQEELDEWTSNVLSAKRLATEFSAVYQMYGKGFSEWWATKNQGEKKDLLMDVTYSSIPLKQASEGEISRALGRPNPLMSRSLYDYNAQSLCGACECRGDGGHYCNGRLIHEMAEWAQNTEKKEQQNIDLSIDFRNRGVFPDLFNGRVAFVMPPSEGEIMDSPMVFNDLAPESEVKEFRQHIEQGQLYDASAVQFAVSRKIFSLSLFVKLFDEYQTQIRRVPSTNPYERLTGCLYCKRSCQADTSKLCSTCKVSWFCCRGCMAAAGHMRCPLGREQDIKVIFN